jgi:hypothetical protein
LTFNPANMAVSFTSGSSLTQSQDAPSLKECNPETLSVSLNLGSAESGPSRCPSEPDSTCWPRPGDSADVARDMSQPTATPRGCYRSSRHSELVGYSAPGRNGQGKCFPCIPRSTGQKVWNESRSGQDPRLGHDLEGGPWTEHVQHTGNPPLYQGIAALLNTFSDSHFSST